MFGNRERLKPSELAKAWGVSVERVLGWIRRGEFPKTIDALPGGKRPRFLIARADIAEFERRQQIVPTSSTPVARQQRRRAPGGDEFFKHGKVVRRI